MITTRASNEKIQEDIKTVFSIKLPLDNSLQIEHVRRESTTPEVRVSWIDPQGKSTEVGSVSAVTNVKGSGGLEPTHIILDKPPLISVKTFNSTVEARINEGDDPNIRQGLVYYRTVKRNGSVVIPVVTDPKTNDVKVLMQNAYRSQIGKFMWEFPMGDQEKGETPLQGAKREFEEETGLVAENVKEVFTAYADAPSSTAYDTFFLAQGFREGHRAEENETIGKLTAFPLEKCLEMIDNKELTNGETIMGIQYVYRMSKEGKLLTLTDIEPTKAAMRA